MLNSNKLFKDQIFHEPVGWVLFVVFEYFSSALLQEIAREIMFLLSNNIHEKGISQRQGKGNFESTRAICNLY